MGPEYKSVSKFETDTALDDDDDDDDDDDKHGQAKKSKVDPPQSSSISTASSEDFFHLDPKHFSRQNDPKTPQENGQSPQRDDHYGWSQGGTSPISDINNESMLQNMPPTQTPPVQVMERHREKENYNYDPDRIPDSAFGSKPSSPGIEWSAASNDSLFSIGLGNRSMPRDHNRKVHDDSQKAGDPLKFKKPFPAMERKGDYKKPEVENKSGSGEPQTGVTKETTDHRSEVRFSPIEVTFSTPTHVLRSDGSEIVAQDFVAPTKKSGCAMCNCSNCKLAFCACTWPSCSCCSCKWLSCCTCKWLSCCSCKWLSCCSCKWLSCCSCKWPSCGSCKWPSCCSCKWLSCSSCKWPSRCSCKWPSCKLSSCCCPCPCMWPSCSSCSCPSCPKCSLKCFKCPNFSCGCPSCSSCSIMCFSCPNCNCLSCSWPPISCWKCKPRKLFCCFSKVSPDERTSDHHKRGSNKRTRCCAFPHFTWSWFSCRCC